MSVKEMILQKINGRIHSIEKQMNSGTAAPARVSECLQSWIKIKKFAMDTDTKSESRLEEGGQDNEGLGS